MKKKWLRTALLAAAFAGLLCVSALAADGGMYNVKEENGTTVKPQTAERTEVTGKEETVNGGEVTLYTGAERVALTYSEARNGSYYVVFALVSDPAAQDETQVPTESNLVYINQATAAGAEVTFNVYPSKLESGRHYTLYLSSNDGILSGLTEVASFDYYLPYTLGDVNEDGDVTAYDATVVLRHVAKIQYMTSANALLAADANGNGTVEADDATRILRYVAKIDSTLG